MTTAARPTFNPAVGGNRASDTGFPTQTVSSKALPGHTKLKLRQPGQNNQDDIARRDLKLQLQKAEQEYKEQKKRGKHEPLKLLDEEDLQEVKLLKKPKLLEEPDLDADDTSSSDSDSSDSDTDSDSDSADDDDDTAELLRELEKIKKERAEEKERLEKEQAEHEEEEKQKQMMNGNPLLNLDDGRTSSGPADFSVKRRWDDDVIFKNQARVEEKPQKRFINDTLRSDFHRKFMNKYVK